MFTIEMIEIKGDKVPAITCAVDNLDGCNDKEKAYVEKAKVKFPDADKLKAEIARLNKISAKKMKEDKAVWISRRLNILNSMVDSSSKKEL